MITNQNDVQVWRNHQLNIKTKNLHIICKIIMVN